MASVLLQLRDVAEAPEEFVAAVAVARLPREPSAIASYLVKRAAYETGMTDLATIAERMQGIDQGTLGALQLFLWERGRQAVTSVDLRQRPTESFVRLTWRGGRDYDASSLDLTDHLGESAMAVDWSAERKREYLLKAWRHVLTHGDRRIAPGARGDGIVAAV